MIQTIDAVVACVSTGVAGVALGALIQAVRDNSILDAKNAVIRNLRRQLVQARPDKPQAPAEFPPHDNDWMRETVQLPEVDGK